MDTETTTETEPAKKAPKRKVASKSKDATPKPPRIPSAIDVPFSEDAQVPLSAADFLNKTHVMLRVTRERENLLAEFESVKAEFKQRIKGKQEEIIELNGELQSNSEKRSVALIARFFPAKKLKRILDAGTKKKVRDEPMTPAEVREHSAPKLIELPPQTPAPDAVKPAEYPEEGAGSAAGDTEVEITGATADTVNGLFAMPDADAGPAVA